ncbi:MAG: RDD family protein [Mycobacteriales bacterium]
MATDFTEAPPEELTTEHLVAGRDRRFYAFVIDRIIAWGILGAEAYVAYVALIEPGHLWAGIATIAGTVLLVWLVTSMLVGLYGLTPGKAMVGLRALSAEDARPVGVLRAMLRSFILGVATLPTLGFGAAALAWTAMVDPSGWRRGWHDLRTGTVVVDVRPRPAAEQPEGEPPPQVVNLTAMRLVPASPTPPRRIPTRGKRPPTPPPTESPVPPTVTPRQGLGWPLVGDAPADVLAEPPAPTPRGPRPTAPPAGVPTGEGTQPRPPLASSPTARWQVTFDTGEQFEVRGLTLVGRRPESRPGEPVKRLVTLPSDDMSLSKTHAQFQVVPDGALVVMDRGSTNGSLLVRAGVTKRLVGGKPATMRDGDRVRFGDREMRVARLS